MTTRPASPLRLLQNPGLAWIAVAATIPFVASRAAAAQLELAPSARCVFAGRETSRAVKISGLPADIHAVSVSWSLQTVAGQRTLAAGENTAAAANGAATLTTTWPVPEVKPGAAATLRFSVRAGPLADRRPGAPVPGPLADRRPGVPVPDPSSLTAAWEITALPENAFADWPQPAKALRLYDPEEVAAALSSAGGPPLLATRSLAELAGLPPATLLVAPGIDPERRDLAVQLWSLVAAGWSVIILEPGPGSLPLPGADGPRLGDIRLADARIVAELDKRLLPVPEPLPPGLVLAARARGAVLSTGIEAAPLMWAELRPVDGPGRLLVCALPLVSAWAESPWARYTLRAYLAVTAQDRGPGSGVTE